VLLKAADARAPGVSHGPDPGASRSRRIIHCRSRSPMSPKASPRRGWLRNGNSPGDPFTAPRCEARTRRGTVCQCPAMRGRRRCRLHGGRSTGPRTAAGLARIRAANTRHGRFSREHLAIQKRLRDYMTAGFRSALAIMGNQARDFARDVSMRPLSSSTRRQLRDSVRAELQREEQERLKDKIEPRRRPALFKRANPT
jgi:hypothetical protein